MIFDLGFVVDHFATGVAYPVRRVPTRARGATGKLLPPETVVDATIVACAQPAQGEELRDPEGNYASTGWVILTRGELGLSRDGFEPDYIRVMPDGSAPADEDDGDWYQVSSLKPWRAAGYIRAVVLISEGPPEVAAP
jgi:hypothetical protein